MKKRSYKAKNFKRVNKNRVFEAVSDQKIVVGIDVAKKDMCAALMDERQKIVETVKWQNPEQTMEMIDWLKELPAKSLEAAMEPTSTYGDPLRYRLQQAGIEVYRVSTKRTHDAAEVYDGVASWHDPKSSAIIAKLHMDGASILWEAKNETSRTLEAVISRMALYEEQHQQSVNKLEAKLARYWPGLGGEILDLDSLTVLSLVEKYGSPANVAADEKGARELMKKTGKTFLSAEKIERVIEVSKNSIGVPMIEEEKRTLQNLATDILRTKYAKAREHKKVEDFASREPSIAAMGKEVGMATAAVLVTEVGDPQNYESADAYIKSAGLNLTEKSSGKHKGELKISKRGSGTARMYLYFSVLRLIQWNPIFKAYYSKKVKRQGDKMKNKVLVTLMRKLLKGLWHVGRGAQFDATKLFDTKILGLAN